MFTDTSPTVREFRAAERRRGMSAGTVEKRVSMVRRWIDWHGEPFNATWHDVEAFCDSTAMAAATSRYAAVSHLHMFYLWAMRHDHTDIDPTALVVRPRLRPGLPRPANDVDLALALVVATDPIRAAIIVAASCGLRCVEIARLRWIDVGIDAMRVTGKGGKERIVPINATAREALDGLDRLDGYVFPWRDDGGASPGRRVSHALNGHFCEVGVDTTAHQLRHWCATQALAGTGDLRAVQDLLGHSSPATTAIYARLDPTRLAAVTASITMPVAS